VCSQEAFVESLQEAVEVTEVSKLRVVQIKNKVSSKKATTN
jgi:hypothetical protein